MYILALTPSNNWMGFCGSHVLVDTIGRMRPFSMFGQDFHYECVTSLVTLSLAVSLAIPIRQTWACNMCSSFWRPAG